MMATLPVMAQPAPCRSGVGKHASPSEALRARPEECLPLRSHLALPVAPVKPLADTLGRHTVDVTARAACRI